MTQEHLREKIKELQRIAEATGGRSDFATPSQSPIKYSDAVGMLFKTFPHIQSFEMVSTHYRTDCRLVSINGLEISGKRGVMDSLEASHMVELTSIKSFLVETDLSAETFFQFCDTLYDLVYILNNYLEDGMIGFHKREHYE